MGAHSRNVEGGVNLVETVNAVKPNNDDDDDDDMTPVEATYSSLIQQYLSVFMFDNATFLAERLVASCKTNHAYYLLALCHFRANSPQRARSVLDVCKDRTAAMQYLLAQCCFQLEEYGPAEQALLHNVRTNYRQAKSQDGDVDEWILSTSPCPVPNGAAGLHLMGEICKKSNRRERAMHYFRLALKLDPMMWTSYEALCEMGANDDPTQVFGVFPAILASQPQEDEATGPVAVQEERGVLTPSFSLSQTPMDATSARPLETPVTAGSSRMPKASLFQASGRSSARQTAPRHGSTSLFETPNLTPIPMNEKSFAANVPASATNPQVITRARKVAARLYYPPSPEMTITPGSIPSSSRPRSLFLSGLDGRRSLSTTTGSVPEDSAFVESPGQVPTTKQPTVHFSAATKGADPKQDASSASTGGSSEATVRMKGGSGDGSPDEEQGVRQILELLCVLGAAHRNLCQYRCREALQIFHRLPQEQFHTGWVLHQVGRAYFENNDYLNAKRHLELMQHVEPHRMKGLEILSTTLWQLKKEVELSHLAQRAVDFDRKCPECWCIVGNCFSLQKEHETALTFFRRSIQLDPSFTYPHTLSGHEYSAIEDFEKAVSCYRDAIRADERHYNAWYGLGAVYYRQEKYDLAEYHFQRALAINTRSSVLHCHVGMAQHANGKPYQALDTLAAAFRLDPINPQGRYQRATIYMAMDRPHEALMELEKVRDAAPREASIHFAMGRVLKRIGRPEQAMRCFLIALDLDPKDANVIKAAMEKLDEPDIDESSAF